MKSLKFSGSKPELILKEKKDTTWRIADEKNITEGDVLSLRRTDGTEFAKARVTLTKETIVRDLPNSDISGHEKLTEKETLRRLSGFYHMKVMPQTSVKVIKFEVLSL